MVGSEVDKEIRDDGLHQVLVTGVWVIQMWNFSRNFFYLEIWRITTKNIIKIFESEGTPRERWRGYVVDGNNIAENNIYLD